MTLGRGELMARMQPVRMPQTLPVVLSVNEVTHLLQAMREPRYCMCWSTLYACRLRLQEGLHLQVGDQAMESL